MVLGATIALNGFIPLPCVLVLRFRQLRLSNGTRFVCSDCRCNTGNFSANDNVIATSSPIALGQLYEMVKSRGGATGGGRGVPRISSRGGRKCENNY